MIRQVYSSYSRIFGKKQRTVKKTVYLQKVSRAIQVSLYSTADQSRPELWTKNKKILDFIDTNVKLCKPKNVHVCNGSDAEFTALTDTMVKSGTLIKLNEKLRPNSFLSRSDPNDVARVEKQTLICSEKEEDAGISNQWRDPKEMKKELNKLMDGCMEGRTMYVIPFCMGPLGSEISASGIQLTDSPYVAASMKVMTRMGKKVLEQIGSDGKFVPCLHSVGYPLKDGKKDVSWPNNSTKWITHFPETKEIISYGSGYGGNALLGKKCYALRIASVMAKEEGWLAEHMLILGITKLATGEKKYIAAAFPSACGKTNLAMLRPTIAGFKIETIGDDIAWMKFGTDGRLYAVNPENGLFGVAPGTSYHTNPTAMETIKSNTIFTNVGLTDEGDVWWKGMTTKVPEHVIDWKGHDWYAPTPGEKITKDPAHPNSRFCVPISNCPSVDPKFEDPSGVPISAIIFGGRRESTVPLVTEAFDWDHGTFMGASIASEQTSAQVEGKVGELRFDPFAMRPFCGYNMADYFQHWLNVGAESSPDKLPKIYTVNWFRKDEKGDFLWPGFGENSRVLQWIFDRTNEGNLQAEAVKTPLGYVPKSLNTEGLDVNESIMERLFTVDKGSWKKDIEALKKHFRSFGERFPKKIWNQLSGLERRLAEQN